MNPLDWIDDALAKLAADDLLRALPAPLSVAMVGGVAKAKAEGLVNFASNDYLGLAADPRLVEAAVEACRTYGVGRAASPLICGRSILHERLERRLAEFLGEEAALLFPTGFAANAGVIPALVDRGDVVYGDAKNHASLIDGCRLARAQREVYPHGDVETLEGMLRECEKFRRRLIVTDSLFSMDGDLAPLPQLVELARRYDAMLLVDEAHAIGVFGSGGRGVVDHFAQTYPAVRDGVHIRIGTLSKALGSAGGFVVGGASLIQWLANRARSYVFSTAHPAANAAAALAALDILAEDPQVGSRLLLSAARLRRQLADLDWDVATSKSQIIPLRVGSAEESLRLAAALREQGFWVPAIRPPSVPGGESLLRLSLTAGHTEEMAAGLVEAMRCCQKPVSDDPRLTCN